MINSEEMLQVDDEPSAFEAHLGNGIEVAELPRVISEEHVIAREKLISGAEIIIELPPVLNHVYSRHNSQNKFSTPLLELENQTHVQAKQISSTESEKKEFKDGTGDFSFFVHIRKPGLYTFSLNCMFDGLSAITDSLWQAKLAEWKKDHLKVNEQVIELKLPDVAFSVLIRQFFASSWFKSWSKNLDMEITNSLSAELKGKKPGQHGRETEHELASEFSNTSGTISKQLEDLIFMMGNFRAKSLYGEEVFQNALPFDQKTDAWYMNAIFGITSNLLVEPFTVFQPVNSIGLYQKYAIEKVCVLTNSLRSRADIVAHTGSERELRSESAALDMIKQETWLGDGNAQTDNLIYQLQKVSDVIEKVINLLSKITGGKWLGLIQEAMGLLSQLKKTEAEFEAELLLKPWIAYAVLPPEWGEEYVQAFRATTHSSSKAHVITHSDLVSIAATDGATTTTRDATKRKIANLFGDETARAIQQLVTNAVGLSPKQLSDWLDKTLHTADDRSVQDQRISKRSFLSEAVFLKLEKQIKKFLPEFEPTFLADKTANH